VIPSAAQAHTFSPVKGKLLWDDPPPVGEADEEPLVVPVPLPDGDDGEEPEDEEVLAVLLLDDGDEEVEPPELEVEPPELEPELPELCPPVFEPLRGSTYCWSPAETPEPWAIALAAPKAMNMEIAATQVHT
jgi:hypothetical protein